MRINRNVGAPESGRFNPGSVQALGVADVLRVVVARADLPCLLDEVDELRRGLDDLRLARRDSPGQAVALPVRDVAHDLRVLSRLRDEIVVGLTEEGPTALWAHAPLMSELVRGTAREAAERLSERLREHPCRTASRSDEVQRLAHSAANWTHTYLALLAIEWFSSDEEPYPTV